MPKNTDSTEIVFRLHVEQWNAQHRALVVISGR